MFKNSGYFNKIFYFLSVFLLVFFTVVNNVYAIIFSFQRIDPAPITADYSDGNSQNPAISGDGLFATFDSTGTNLVVDDDNSNVDVFLYSAQNDSIEIVSINSNGDYGNNGSSSPDVSSDGRFITFISDATNLVSGDTNSLTDVFVHDTQTGITTRVSVDSLGVESNASSYSPKISEDGRYVTFSSWADNLVAGDTNGSSDVFLHDTQTGDTTRVSVDSLGNESDGYSAYSNISSDGRYVVFESEATNLVAGDVSGVSDVFLHDTQTGDTTRVSVDGLGDEGNDYSYGGDISSDGRYISFYSDATDLVAGDTNVSSDVFLHDTQTGDTTRVSVDSLGNESDGYSASSSISGNGRYITFYSDATNLDPADSNSSSDVFLHDTQTGDTTRVSVDSLGNEGDGISNDPSISSDGVHVIFVSSATNLVSGDTNGFSDIFWYDTQLQDQIMVSSGISSQVDIQTNEDSFIGCSSNITSSDGRYVVFDSEASNLVSGDTNGQKDIFLHDTQTGITTRVSVDSLGNESNNLSGCPNISSDGRYVSFGSSATNLVSGDTNGQNDIFVHDTQTGDTTRVSVDSLGNQSNNPPPTILHGISSDGRYVSFHSHATNLVSGDTNTSVDVFLHDTQTGDTTRVSVDSLGNEGNGSSQFTSMSLDGRYVVFVSDATNLDPADSNSSSDVFLHDTQTGDTTRVSVDSLGNEGDTDSYGGFISPDNEYVYFISSATNLVSGDTNNADDIFIYNIQTGNVSLFSTSINSNTSNIFFSNNGIVSHFGYIYRDDQVVSTDTASLDTYVSLDGQKIFFVDGNSNGIPDTNGFADIFYSEIIFASLSHSGNFTESNSNDGSIAGERIVTITNDTFVNSGSTLTLNTHYTLDNVPDGLTPVLSVSQDGITATLTFTGSATSHSNANDISNLTITFLDPAFTLEDIAVSVINYSNNQGAIDFIDANGSSGGSGSNPNPVLGCTDSDATNYNSFANRDDGSCIYTPGAILGCTDQTAGNYSAISTVDNGSCLYGVFGCMDISALNYNSQAVYSNNSCIYPGTVTPPITPPGGGPNEKDGCMEPGALNYDPSATKDDGSCNFLVPFIDGCTDISAENYNSYSTRDDGSCTYIPSNPDPDTTPNDPFLGGLISGISDFIEKVPQEVVVPVAVGGVVIPSILLFFLQPGLIAGAVSVPIRIWNLVPVLMGYRRKKRPWGTVYDSITKQPLDPVYVTLKTADGKDVATSITDMDGRFGFLVPAGKYFISANKANYIFPSVKLAGKEKDELYENLYFGAEIEVKEKEDVVFKNIPMDSINFNWNEFEKAQNKKLMKFYSKADLFLARISGVLFVSGFVSSLILFFLNNSILNSVILALYFVIIILRFFGIKPRQSGRVSDEKGYPLSFGVVRLFSAGLGREVSHSVIGKTGKYYMLTPNGEYYIKISKKTGEDSYEDIYTSGNIKVKGGYVRENIVV